MPRRILIIRLSSIGDIVLTTPVLRMVREAAPDAEIHMVTKTPFMPLVQHNPCVDVVHGLGEDMEPCLRELRAVGFDQVIDLQGNFRSAKIRRRLRARSVRYRKDRWQNLLYIKFRIGTLAKRHTVERYSEAVNRAGYAGKPGKLEFPLPEQARSTAATWLAEQNLPEAPVCAVLGATHGTKKWPLEYWAEFLNTLRKPVLLLGGTAEAEAAAKLISRLRVPVANACGALDLLGSAALLPLCTHVVSHDTGYMHIAAALGCKLTVLWGNTVPALGFSAWRHPALNMEVKDLDCRPCTKLGHPTCPKKHFKCMRDLMPADVILHLRKMGEAGHIPSATADFVEEPPEA